MSDLFLCTIKWQLCFQKRFPKYAAHRTINATVTKDIDLPVFCGNISDFNKYPVIQVI